MSAAPRSASRRIVRWGVAAGLAGLVAGFVAPLYLTPEANLGPLLFIVTAPAGALLGALAAVLSTAWRAAPGDEELTLRWLFALYGLAFLWTWFAFGITAYFAVPGLALQAVVVAAAAALWRTARHRWPTRSAGLLGRGAAVGVLVLLLALVPPVRGERGRGIAFLLDSRLDSSTRRPELVVDRPLFALEVVLALVGAIAIGGRAARRAAADRTAVS